jgi:hypothetical protein
MPHAGGIAPGHETIAIVLDLVQPAGWSVLERFPSALNRRDSQPL